MHEQAVRASENAQPNAQADSVVRSGSSVTAVPEKKNKPAQLDQDKSTTSAQECSTVLQDAKKLGEKLGEMRNELNAMRAKAIAAEKGSATKKKVAELSVVEASARATEDSVSTLEVLPSTSISDISTFARTVLAPWSTATYVESAMTRALISTYASDSVRCAVDAIIAAVGESTVIGYSSRPRPIMRLAMKQAKSISAREKAKSDELSYTWWLEDDAVTVMRPVSIAYGVWCRTYGSYGPNAPSIDEWMSARNTLPVVAAIIADLGLTALALYSRARLEELAKKKIAAQAKKVLGDIDSSMCAWAHDEWRAKPEDVAAEIEERVREARNRGAIKERGTAVAPVAPTGTKRKACTDISASAAVEDASVRRSAVASTPRPPSKLKDIHSAKGKYEAVRKSGAATTAAEERDGSARSAKKVKKATK